jgi:putative transposase
MVRARQFFIPGVVWHITHRCHDRSFLLKFQRDKQAWRSWLFKAKTVYGTKILNYVITSNHIHLLVYADHNRWVIPRSMQLVAGRTGWEYNQRKNRTGAFWEGSYHAIAVQSDRHLLECMVYIDLNMVRAGVISHPEDWRFCGYSELVGGRQRYSLLDEVILLELLGAKDMEHLRRDYSKLVEDAIRRKYEGMLRRDSRWSEGIAVGDESFIRSMQERLGYKAKYRHLENSGRSWLLRDGLD